MTRTWDWSWTSDALPRDFGPRAWDWPAFDRQHAKQGRSTARIRVDGPDGPVWGYLKRHGRLSRSLALAARIAGRPGLVSPAAVERDRLGAARLLGLDVPRALAVGERLGRTLNFSSYLLVAELTGRLALNEALPELSLRPDWETLRRTLAAQVAGIAARLHGAGWYHKDLYLCHFYVDPDRPADGLSLIDLQRMRRHPLTGWRWRIKDLGQLHYATRGVAGITDRDRLRAWSHYRKLAGLRWPRAWSRLALAKSGRYARHNGGE